MRCAVFLLLSVVPPMFAAQSCESLAKLSLPNAVISHAEVVSDGGAHKPRMGRPEFKVPPFCRVAGSIRPSSDSDIQFEVWMPVSGWNGKFQGVGNGGFGGVIRFEALGAAVVRGYAAAATDTGHTGASVNAEWALNHPEKVIDFGHRAIHETTVKAKAIITAFYGAAPKRSYFASCSNGGRQALMEAQRYPEDYDGVIAGAPANYWTRLFANAVWDMLALAGKGAYIPAAKLPAIQNATLAACDAQDGVKDGVIENPPACRFDPSALLCQGAETDACLTAPQLAALKKLYAGKAFPGYAPGGEAAQSGWALWITGTAPERSLMHTFGAQYFRHMVFSNPEWDYRTFDLDRDLKAAEAKTGAILNAVNPDLSRFQARGGKLILYHGWCDAAIAPQNAINYYQSVAEKMGAAKTAGFVRLFMIPGMQHCGSGSITNPEDDMDAALERWVEQGVAPERIVVPLGPRKAPLCAYPAVARHKGQGATDDPANFDCVKP